MERPPSWKARAARRIEAAVGLVALAASAWMFSSMSEATTVAVRSAGPQGAAGMAGTAAAPSTTAPAPAAN